MTVFTILDLYNPAKDKFTLQRMEVGFMKFQRAELIDNLELPVGETIELESLRQAIIPPYLMLMPFIETPDEVIVEGQYRLDEDGIHGCVYRLKSEKPCKGEIVIGFRNIQTGEITHRKAIQIVAQIIAN